MAQSKRYYYKSKDGKGFLNLKSPLTATEAQNYEEITEEEFVNLTHVDAPVDNRTEEEVAADHAKTEKLARISFLKGQLAKTDYIVIKIAEATTKTAQDAIRSEYEETLANRVAWRAEINELEEEVA